MASESPGSDDQPSSLPPATRSRKATSPAGLFREPDPSAEAEAVLSSPLLPPPGDPYENDFETDAPATPRRTSSTLSATDKKALVLALEDVAGLIGEGLHGLVANDVEQEFELYLLDDGDRTGIAKPSASLLHRHGVIDGGADISDLIALFVAVASYLAKQFRRRRDARNYARTLYAATATQEPAA